MDLKKIALLLLLVNGIKAATFVVYKERDHQCYTQTQSCQTNGTCQRFEVEEHKCLDDNSWIDKIQSIDTFGYCIKIWQRPNCSGIFSIMAPGTPHHKDLNKLKLAGDNGASWSQRVVSISGCEYPPTPNTTTTSRRFCNSNQFPCNGGMCINLSWKCDGDDDCENGEDEINCPKLDTTTTTTRRPFCNSKQFTCNSGRCIYLEWKCDGGWDCENGEDEFNCTKLSTTTVRPSCKSDEFTCNTGKCINLKWKCDGDNDCGTGEDENNCETNTKNTSSPISATNVPMQIEHLDMDTFQIFDSEITAQERSLNVKMPTYLKSEPLTSLDGNTVIFRDLPKVLVYIHGYATSDLNDGQEIKNAVFEGTNDVDAVVLLDWRQWSLPFDDSSPSWPPNYRIVALNNLPRVADTLNDFLKSKMRASNHIYLVGFSLGAHVAGTAARKLTSSNGWIINRITGLDPSGPIFEYSLGIFPIDRRNALRKTDASFIDVVHASTTLGMTNEAGHLDIYIDVNYECKLPSCIHQKTVELFITSLTKCSLITCPSGKLRYDYPDYYCHTAEATDLSSLGYLADRYSGRGKHEIKLLFPDENGKRLNKFTNCSNYLNLNLPAKGRICHKRPNNNEASIDCVDKPYLSKCRIFCPTDSSWHDVECTANGKSLIRTSRIDNTRTMMAADTEDVAWTGAKDCAKQESCKKENGWDVPYFIAYTVPDSYDYYLMYPGLRTPLFQSGERHDARSQSSVFAKTLQPIYQVSDNPANYIMWNDDVTGFSSQSQNISSSEEDSSDEEPVGPFSLSNGHSKGVLVFNAVGGFLLVHSIPKYPKPPPTPYEFRKSKLKAQIAICVSFGNDQNNPLGFLKKILTEIRAFRPKVYSSRVSSDFDETVRDLVAKLENPGKQPRDGAPLYTYFPISNFRIHVAGKTNEFLVADIFEKLADHYKTSLLVQTWKDRKTKTNLLSSCHRQFTVENINQISVGNQNWDRTKDHSKWAVSKASIYGEHIVVCIGDLNRANSTLQRGGMFICTQDYDVFNMFRAPVAFENCP